jgi:predicted Zn-dependent protease
MLARAAEQIQVTLNRQEQAALVKSTTVNPEAYQAYLKGRYFWNKRIGDGLKKAIEYFSRSIATDPTYAEAYSGLAHSYASAGDWKYGMLSPQDALPKARAAALYLRFHLSQRIFSMKSFRLASCRLLLMHSPGHSGKHGWRRPSAR